jgi:geranylgeranyl pyrophosphate synthase
VTSERGSIERQAEQIDALMRTWIDRAAERVPAAPHSVGRRLLRGIRAYSDSGGKRMHGVSQLLAFRAAGGSPREAILPVAAGFQLYHHHTLIHDDIYDEDFERRGSPTTHRAVAQEIASHVRIRRSGREHLFAGPAERFGAVAAFAQGKMTHALAFAIIMSAPFPANQLLTAVDALTWHDLSDNLGQLADVFCETGALPDRDTCLAISDTKTGRLFAVGARTAALLAGANEETTAALAEWARCSGLAYQLKDDLEDLYADSEKGVGRGIGTDIYSRKPTYLLACALEELRGEERAALMKWLGGNGSAVEVARIAAMLRSSTVPERVQAQVDLLQASATAALDAVRPAIASDLREEMAGFTRYFLSDAYWKRSLPYPVYPLAAE